MENTKLLAALRAFKTLFDNLPKEPLNEEYASAAEQLYLSYMKILYPMLETQYFAFGTDPKGDYTGIFDNEVDRDSFINEMHKINEERKERGNTSEMICKPITFEEFLDFAKYEVFELDNYSLAEDGAIEFIRSSDSVETTV